MGICLVDKIYLIAIDGAGLIEPGTENNIFWCPADHSFRSLRYCIIWGSGVYTTLSDANLAFKSLNIPNTSIVCFGFQFLGKV